MQIESSELNPATASVLRRFSVRRSRLLWLRALAVGLLALAATMTVVMLIDYRWLLPTAVRLLLSVTGYVVSAAAMWWVSLRFLKHNDRQQIAKQLESVDPRLREDLLSAVELSSEEGANGSLEFRDRLQRVVARRAAGMDVAKLLPLNLLRAWITAAAVVACLVGILLLIPPLQVGRRIARAMLPGLAIERASITQVEIISPDPATGFVAHGDAVGIIANISNMTRLGWGQWLSEEGVWLQYQSGDSQTIEIEMTPRSVDASALEVSDLVDISRDDEFAANLMMGQLPVRYRIIAGDAVTLWNTLTPRSRPHVGSFVKEYVYPVYAHLPNTKVREDHGDLRAVAGTRATITVEFDEPVTEAVIRLGIRRRSFDMKSVEGSTTFFRATLPIESPSQYQVDAVSRQSGLSNPFGRHYSIVPLVDSPPIVRWDETLPAIQVVSPMDVVSLSAEIVDDLPIDRVLQKTLVNGKPLNAVPIALGPEDRRHTLSFQWDLFATGQKLSVGDMVQTRLVAIDRRGQMSDSEVLEFLIAEEGYDSQRHDSLDRLHRLTEAIHDWFKQAKPATEAFESDSESWKSLQTTTDSVIAKIESELSRAATADAGSEVDIAASLEQIGNAMIDWRTRIAMMRMAGEDETSRESKTQPLSRLLDLVDDDARSLFSHTMTVGVMSDAISLRRSLAPLLDPTSHNPALQIPASRYPRYLNVLAGRLDTMDTLIGSHSSQLQTTTIGHIEKWREWSDRWTTALRDLSEQEIKTDDNAKRVLDRLSLFETELRHQTRHSLLDGRLVSSLSQNVRELDRATGSISDTIAGIAEIAETAERSQDQGPYTNAVAELSLKISSQVSLQRRLPEVDLRYAADLNLVKGAMKAVSSVGYVADDGEPAERVHEKIVSAISLLTAAHRVESGRRNIARLASDEKRLSDTAKDRIDHPTRLERFATSMEHTIDLLKHAKIDWTLVKPIDQTRFGSDYTEARDRITRRRWSEDAMQSATAPLGEIRDKLKQGLEALAPLIDNARDVLLKYAPSIGELAIAAAIEAEEKDTATQSDDVVESLHDLANTADLMNRDDRELARDADSAAAQIQAAMQDVQNANPTEDKAALQELAEVLRKTAEHFNHAKNGDDLSESREELRAREQELNLAEDLDKLSKRTESIAEAAAKTPQELLKQLEQQLQRNEAMQDELDDIADRTQKAIQLDLARLAEDENTINQTLEGSDPEMRERKRRVSKQLSAASKKLQSIQDSLVAGAKRSSDWGNLEVTREELQHAQSDMTEASEMLNSLKSERDPMATLRDAAKRAADSVAGVADSMNAIAESAAKQTDQNLHQNENARGKQQQSLEQFERESRRKQISGQRIAESLWKGEQNSAKQRANSQKRKRSDAFRQAKRLRQIADKLDAKSEPQKKSQERQKQIDAFEEKAKEAERALKAAEETLRFTDQRVSEAIADRKILEREKLKPLDQPNPAAQLAQRMTETATEDLRVLEQALHEAAAEMDASDDLVANPDQAKKLVERQSRVTDDVQRAADDLRRISRHQKRLGDNARAEEMSDVASEIEQGAKVASENAEKDLQDVSESPDRSPQANRQIARAMQEISDAGKKLSSDASPNAEDSRAEDSRDDQDRLSNRSDRQLAQTLDELDRSIAKSQEGDDEKSTPNPTPSTKPNNAGDASPTLSAALQTISQQVARRRQQSTEPKTPSESNQPGADGASGEPTTDEGPPSGDPTDSQGMPGNPPGGPSVPITGIDRQGSDWGQLRSRSDENTGQTGRALVPNQYRREIEAYFRVIASKPD